MTLQTAHSRRADLPPAALDPPPLVAAVAAALDRAGVRWTFLRGEATLAAPPHDVDCLIDVVDVASFEGAVRPLGVLPVPTWDKGSHRSSVARAPSLGRCVILDVVTELSYSPGVRRCSPARPRAWSAAKRSGPWRCSPRTTPSGRCCWTASWTKATSGAPERERLRVLSPAARADSELGVFASGVHAEGWDAERLPAERWTVLRASRDHLVGTWRPRHPPTFVARRGLAIASRRAAPLHTLLTRGALGAGLLDDDDDAQSRAAAVAHDSCLPLRVVGVSPPGRGRAREAWRAAVNSAAVRFHAGPGRLVVLVYSGTWAAGDGEVRVPRPRRDLLLVLRPRRRSRNALEVPARVKKLAIDVSAAPGTSDTVLEALSERHANPPADRGVQ